MRDEMSRRRFLGHAALLGGALRLRLRAGPTLRVAVVGMSTKGTDARGMGLTLGAEEASHAALLFGGGLTFVPLARAEAQEGRLSAIIGDGNVARTMKWGAEAAAAGIPFLNVGCEADELRMCGRSMFHVAPSAAMRRDASALADATGKVVAWHPSLVRFGADTLNRRFQLRFGQPMHADAWTAWFATKVLWETAVRVGTGDGKALVSVLGADTNQFDGHKGLPLSFRTWDHQLRQPLYVEHGGRVDEVPPAARPGEPARQQLDRIGSAQCRA